MKIGVEAAYGFGDCLFNLPLIKAISEHYNQKVNVATKSHCVDAFMNIPFVDNIDIINNLNEGYSFYSRAGYTAFQLTQNIKFEQFIALDGSHSLIDTPMLTGREIGIKPFNQKPIFIPTINEINDGNRYDDGMPTIAIESVFTSGQSWATQNDIDLIVDKFKDTHRICWLSNQNAPKTKYIDDMLRWSRRTCICALAHCGAMFSVGSGFFCASMALPKERQPKKIICLWIDSYYRYEKRIAELELHSNIQWIHNRDELIKALDEM
jgi:hypothetical protein